MRSLMRKSRNNRKDKLSFESMAIPVAFINGLFFGGYALRKIRQYWEGGPMD